MVVTDIINVERMYLFTSIWF